ncbi:MAG TPA: DUF5946 family protein [Ktedonobacterales bacterium]|jgi:hypothetical protein
MEEAGIVCPGCGVALASADHTLDASYNASAACVQVYGELSAYTLTLGDAGFIHQFIVDTYAAQHVGPAVKPIRTAFSLIGLYLACERGYTGRQVQHAHMLLARQSKVWPQFRPPPDKATLTVLDVVQAPESARQEMIVRWSQAVWDMWKAEHAHVAELARTYLGL